jgi:D-alanyl-D-alanine carboxypeptidase
MVDGNSGAILASNNIDAPRHPASLTKIMTLYLLFERLDSGKVTLDTEMPVSQHASEQDPTKLGLAVGSTLRVEDAIKGIVTRSANDAAVVIAEYLGGTEDNFGKMMTRKAHALGMSKTNYHNASGLPDDAQITTARDQSILGRAIQDRFPRYYHYFSTDEFRFHGHVIGNHNHLIGSVAGVDGIKTGYTRASGFNLVTSMKRDGRFLLGVVLGGRSGGSRDAIMRNLLAENFDQAATRRTVAAITERNGADIAVADAQPAKGQPANLQVADASDDDEDDAAVTAPIVAAAPPPAPVVKRPVIAAAPQLASVDPAPAPIAAPPAPLPSKKIPAPLSSGVLSSQSAQIPGSDEPMTPVRVHTVQVKSGPAAKMVTTAPMRLSPAPATDSVASNDLGAAPSPIVTSAIAPVANAPAPDKTNAGAIPMGMTDQRLPARNPAYGTGQGILGVLPARTATAMASADPAQPIPAPTVRATLQARADATPQSSPAKPIVHSGWIIQVGALESESEARTRLDTARDKARSILGKADPFTETVAKGDKQLYRARFAGLDKDTAEAACRTLKRSDISCITVKN